MAKLKVFESDACSELELEHNNGNDKGKEIIYVETSATLVTPKIQKNEPKDLEEGECLFHS